MLNTVQRNSTKLAVIGLLIVCSVVTIAYRQMNKPDPVMETFIKRLQDMHHYAKISVVDNHDGSVTVTSGNLEVPHTMTFTRDHAILAVKSDRSQGIGDFMFVVFKHPVLGPLATNRVIKQDFDTKGDFRVVELSVPADTDLTMLDTQAN